MVRHLNLAYSDEDFERLHEEKVKSGERWEDFIYEVVMDDS